MNELVVQGSPSGDGKPYIEVPHRAAGKPMMMLSDTPRMRSVFPYADASKSWSVVFSKEASIKTLSFILATPKRVIPRISPCDDYISI